MVMVVMWGDRDQAMTGTIFFYNVCVSKVILQTKLNIPPLRPALVERAHLIDKLNEGLLVEGGPDTSRPFNRKLTLISAPAGFGKTTLISSWLHQLDEPPA